MIHTEPTHYAYCDLCMRRASASARTVPDLLKAIAAEGWYFEEGKEYCQDLMFCAECRAKRGK